jgi:hypothetical protein
MGKRGLPLVFLAVLGALIAWWLSPDEVVIPPDAPPRAARAAPAVADEPLPRASTSSDAESRSFNLPKMSPPARDASAPADAPDTISVPKHWLLRGSASKSYELRTERDIVLSGNYSAMLFSHAKEIQPNLSGSGVQAVLAAPYVGTRVQLSAALRMESAREGAGAIWVYVTDPGRVVIAYQIAQMTASQVAGEWGRYRIVMDVPWNAEVLAIGFTLQGRGKLWADDVKLTPVDTNVPVTGKGNNHQLGVIAQAVSVDSALANPTNLDFEDVLVTRERQPPPPPDEIKGTRF